MAPSSSEARARETQPLLIPWTQLTPDLVAPDLQQNNRQPPSVLRHGEQRQQNVLLGLGSATLAFFVNGMVIASLGVLVPFAQVDYDLSDIQVSAIFLTGPAGYCLAALFSNTIHLRLGRRGIAVIAPLCQLTFALTGAARKPFQVLVAASILGGFGGGLLDISCCAWVGAMNNANTLSGFLHGGFSAGAALGPFLAGTMISVGHIPWYCWYYVLAGGAGVSGIVLFLGFREETGAKYCEARRVSERYGELDAEGSALSHPSTWIFAIFLLGEVGSESTVTNWVVSFMIRVRGASPFLASVCSSGFWGGMAVGRLVLGTVTDRLGPRRAVILYLALASLIATVFSVLKNTLLSVGLIILQGFLFGPLFPSCIVQLVQSLPAGQHVQGVSFVSSIGQVGGALLPYGLGAITHALGLVAFQYLLIAQVVSVLLIWLVSMKIVTPRA